MIKIGNPENIIILDVELESTGYFRNLIYGMPNLPKYDGIHLSGEGAVRQFTYQAIKQFKAKVYTPVQRKPAHRQVVTKDNHLKCPQAQFQRKLNRSDKSKRSQNRNKTVHPRPQSYAEAVGNNNPQYNVPTYNRYETLNC